MSPSDPNVIVELIVRVASTSQHNNCHLLVLSVCVFMCCALCFSSDVFQHADPNATDPDLRDSHSLQIEYLSNSVLRDVNLSSLDPPLKICDSRIPVPANDPTRQSTAGPGFCLVFIGGFSLAQCRRLSRLLCSSN